MKILETRNHPNSEGYVIVTFVDGTEKVLPTTDRVNNIPNKRKLFSDSGELTMVDEVMSGKKELLDRFGIMEFGDKTLVLKK